MGADPRGYYRILRVAPSATPEAIKQAYRTMAKALHPDLNRGQDTTAAFQAVNEAYGMAMLEAQAAGVPVVSSAVRGVPDVVVDGVTGLLASEGDLGGLTARVRGLLMDPAKRKLMGAAAARIVAQERSTARAAAVLQAAVAPLGRAPDLHSAPRATA